MPGERPGLAGWTTMHEGELPREPGNKYQENRNERINECNEKNG